MCGMCRALQAKLLNRIPHAAKHALAIHNQAAGMAPSHLGATGGDGGKGGMAVGGKGLSSDGGGSVGSAGGLLKRKEGGTSSRGVSSTGEPSAPADVADVPAKVAPTPLASV